MGDQGHSEEVPAPCCSKKSKNRCIEEVKTSFTFLLLSIPKVAQLGAERSPPRSQFLPPGKVKMK